MLMVARRKPSLRLFQELVYRLRSFTVSKRGSVFVELAFTMPILAAILVGGVEIGRYILIHQKLNRLADSTSDLVAQKKTLTTADLDDIFESAEYILHPFELGSEGVIHISSVTAAPAEDPAVDWQVSGAGDGQATSTVGNPGNTAHLPEGFVMDDGENVIISEVYYEYQPAIFEMFTSSRTIYYRSLDRPRFGALSQLN